MATIPPFQKSGQRFTATHMVVNIESSNGSCCKKKTMNSITAPFFKRLLIRLFELSLHLWARLGTTEFELVCELPVVKTMFSSATSVVEAQEISLFLDCLGGFDGIEEFFLEIELKDSVLDEPLQISDPACP